MKIRAWVKVFFGFSRKETNAFIILIPLMGLTIFSQPLYEALSNPNPPDFTRDIAFIDSLQHAISEKKKEDAPSQNNPLTVAFNPNTASQHELLSLGFSEQLSARIVNYRNKGGVFRKSSDLLKIYGMDTALYQRIKEMVQITSSNETVQNKNKPATQKELADINQADTTLLKTIYGVGSKLSVRIIKYRDKLGGFVSLEQLHEVYALDSPAIEKMKSKFRVAPDFEPKKLKINSASEAELGSHPYIGYKLAKTIAAYRFQNGSFRTAEDLMKIVTLDERTFLKMKPYISVNP